jgi:CBS domain-containing protein
MKVKSELYASNQKTNLQNEKICAQASKVTLETDIIRVQDVMTRDIVSISPEETIEKAARVMTNFNISCLIVQLESKILGIITERDVLTRIVASGRNPKDVLIMHIMTHSIITAKPNTSIETAIIKMIKYKIKKLPVVSDDNSRIIGIISLTDIARAHKWKKNTIRTNTKPLGIEILLIHDEGQHLEFKSSFRYCRIRKEINPELEYNCLKTICAFLNASGGDLIIGISDSNLVVGIEEDYMFIKKRNRDGFQNYLLNQISNKVGNVYLKHVEIRFHVINEREICQVHVYASQEPAFLNHKGKQHFFVRAGNGSRSFNISDASKYIKTKWG